MRVVQFPANANRALREHLHMRISHWLYKGQIPFSFSLRDCKAHQSTEAMAEAPDLRDKSLEELEEEITCAVCHDHYQEVKLLPCMHYYCRACIEKLAERSRGRPFPCPECRKDTTLPSGGAEQLQSAFFVERMKDVYGTMAKAEGRVEAVCESCSHKGKAIAFCRQCTAFLCAHCVEQHKMLRVFAGHKVATLEDLKKGGAMDIPLKKAPPSKCSEHDDQIMTLFCFDCNRLICRDCTVIDHNGHKFNFLKKCATESRKALCDSLTLLRKVQANIMGADKKLVATEAQVDAQEKEVCQTIKQSFAQLKAILEQREMELLNKAVTLAREKKDALMAQRKGLQMAETETQSLVEFVERNVENTSDQDLMVIRTQLQAKMEEEEKRHQQLSLEPATTADITYDPPSPDAIPRDLAEVFRLSLKTGSTSIAELGKPVTVAMGALPHRNPTIQAELKSLVDPASSVQADVVQKGVGVYNITCIPCIRGQHDLTVKVNGKDIVGSPFRVFVKIHPTQLGPPVRTITGVREPWGIALNNKQQLVVGELQGKKVSIMERDGKRVQTIKCDKFQRPCGVATSPDGAIYVIDDKALCLFKFSKDKRLLKTVQNELKDPFFIKTIKNRLYVSDRDNNLVKIFDTDCSVIGTIRTSECRNPEDITEGDNGLYVVGGDKIGVYSCAPNGDFIRHLNIQPSSVKLSSPRGICFDCSGHLFVTQTGYGVECVYVFTPSEGHVASFGLASSGVSMVSPAGIAIDEDGFVYVCDSILGKVVVF